MYNTTEKSPCVADTQGDPVLFLEADHVIGRTAHDAAELFQRDHGDVLVLLQGIQRLVVDAALEKLVLGHAIFCAWYPTMDDNQKWRSPPSLAAVSIIGENKKIYIVDIATMCYNGSRGC